MWLSMRLLVRLVVRLLTRSLLLVEMCIFVFNNLGSCFVLGYLLGLSYYHVGLVSLLIFILFFM
jgi:hypothetical protein